MKTYREILESSFSMKKLGNDLNKKGIDNIYNSNTDTLTLYNLNLYVGSGNEDDIAVMDSNTDSVSFEGSPTKAKSFIIKKFKEYSKGILKLEIIWDERSESYKISEVGKQSLYSGIPEKNGEISNVIKKYMINTEFYMSSGAEWKINKKDLSKLISDLKKIK